MIERVGACVKALPESSQRRIKFLDIGGGTGLNAENG